MTKQISAVIMILGVALAVIQILPVHGSYNGASAVQIIQVYTQGLFIMVGAYISGRLIENFAFTSQKKLAINKLDEMTQKVSDHQIKDEEPFKIKKSDWVCDDCGTRNTKNPSICEKCNTLRKY